MFVTCACVLQQDVCIFVVWYTHNTRHSQHHTAHVYLIRQEAAPVTFSCLFMMCRVQCRGQKTDEVEAPILEFVTNLFQAIILRSIYVPL